MRHLDSQDLIDLSLLLLARDTDVTARTAVPAVQRWGAPAFQPAADDVAGRLWELVRLNLLHVGAGSAGGYLGLTEEGRAHAASLLAREECGTCRPVHIAQALRMALADALPEPAARPI
jgi:hypothetical protein